MSGYIKIKNTAAQHENYIDLATAHGWNGEGDPYPFICQLFFNDVIKKVSISCVEQLRLKGALNYNVEQMIDIFKATTTVEWIVEE